MQKNMEAQGASKRWKRILLIVLAVLVLVAAAVVWWFVANYRNYNVYRDLLTAPAAEVEGTEFAPLESADAGVPGFKLAAANDTMQLWARPDTGEVALRDLRDGTIVYSNPQDADKDPIAGSISKEALKSQFILNYLNANAGEGTAWNSYAKAVKNDQMEMTSIPDGVRTVYTLSDQQLMLCPHQMTVATYNRLMESLPADGQKRLTDYFLFWPAELPAADYSSTIANMSDDMAAAFTPYLRQDGEVWHLELEGAADGLYIRNKKGDSSRQIMRMDQDFRGVDFTIEEYEENENLIEREGGDVLSFEIALEWRLTGDGCEVTIPCEGVKEYGGGMIRSIQLLPFMGAASQDENGYMVVPDGSGALIRFNNGKSSYAQYNQSIYDLDLIDADVANPQNMQTARLALFGICRDTSSLLVTVERGASLCSVVADVAGRNNSYNFVYPTFTMRHTDTLIIVGEEAPVAEKDYYNVDVTVRYSMLGSDYAGYSGLARACRERLEQGGVLKAKEAAGDIPFYYDVIGGVKETAHWLGVQYLRVLPMTTFSQAVDMVSQLKHDGVSNQKINLQGWMNGGYYHDAIGRGVSVLGQLGGDQGLRNLQDEVIRSGGRLYPDVALQLVTDISRSYFPSEEASRFYAEGYAVEVGLTSPVTYRRTATLGYRELGYTLLSPKFLPRYTEQLGSAIRRLELKGISLRDLASDLHADKRRTNVIHREAALDIVRAQFGEIAATGAGVMVSGGNDYSFSAASDVLNAPVEATMFYIVDEQIPLWEMIVHGSIDYAGTPMNLQQTGDVRADLLHLVEYGASTHYTFTWRDAADMKYTGLGSKFATTFSQWEQEAVSHYSYVNGALKHVSGAAMTEHEKLTDTLSRVRYANGVTIYVNYASEEAQADGITVPAADYLVVGGEGA